MQKWNAMFAVPAVCKSKSN